MNARGLEPAELTDAPLSPGYRREGGFCIALSYNCDIGALSSGNESPKTKESLNDIANSIGVWPNHDLFF